MTVLLGLLLGVGAAQQAVRHDGRRRLAALRHEVQRPSAEELRRNAYVEPVRPQTFAWLEPREPEDRGGLEEVTLGIMAPASPDLAPRAYPKSPAGPRRWPDPFLGHQFVSGSAEEALR